MKKSIALLFVCGGLSLAACATTPSGSSRATVEEAETFIATLDQELRELQIEIEKIAWLKYTHITPDTDWLLARADEKLMREVRRFADAAQRFEGLDLSAPSARKLALLRLWLSAPGPSDANARRELATVSSELTSAYGKGQYCPAEGDCLDLGAMSDIMAQSRNYDELLEMWTGWRKVAPPMRDNFSRFVELTNRGASELGFTDVGQLWRSRYDMPPQAIEAEGERLWQQVKPLYESLHCYVRRKLSEHYGADKVPLDEPIPAHLLGNMWAQEWNNIYDLVAPYPEEPDLDVTTKLVAKGYDAHKMVRQAESFFVSLGMPELPESFWKNSMITKPRDREVVCHASAWEMGGVGDVRIKMCTKVTGEDLFTVHHELGHIYYYLMYQGMPPLFQQGANDGFHEGIGDTLMLSVTPKYLVDIGLFDKVPNTPKSDVNFLMKRALDKVAFFPFGKLIDQWRWEVFDGRIKPEQYNTTWWKLRTKYQGIASPVARTEADFDPGAKYHIPNNTPYLRYFLATVLQFQFHRALCKTAGHKGPLNSCSIAGSKEAGKKLADMMRMGATEPWPKAMQAIAGEDKMDATAMLDYFAPLTKFLDEQNAGQTCGW